MKTKSAKASLLEKPTPPKVEEQSKDEEEEEVATHLGGRGPLTDQFTMANLNLDEDNCHI